MEGGSLRFHALHREEDGGEGVDHVLRCARGAEHVILPAELCACEANERELSFSVPTSDMDFQLNLRQYQALGYLWGRSEGRLRAQNVMTAQPTRLDSKSVSIIPRLCHVKYIQSYHDSTTYLKHRCTPK